MGVILSVQQQHRQQGISGRGLASFECSLPLVKGHECTGDCHRFQGTALKAVLEGCPQGPPASWSRP